jgi:predicted lipid-binding transport protein (Tim44 family)
MRQLFLCILLLLSTVGLAVNDAAAKGFSGARGFGTMRSKNVFTYAPAAHRANPARKNHTNNRWRGALGGLLLGSVLTSLLMGHGIGSALFSWFIIGMSIYLVVNFLRRKRHDDL